MDELQVSSQSARILVSRAAETRASTVNARVLLRPEYPGMEASVFSARTLLSKIRNQNHRVSIVNGRVLLRLSPNFRWIDMFSDVIFPHDISQNSDAATRFNTLVNQVASGHDARQALWDYPLMEYNVAYGVRTLEQLHDLIRLYRAMRGQLNSFRFLDKLDHTSNFAEFEEARDEEPVEFTDQAIGTGDNETVSFQLIKTYDFDTESATRPIYKPIQGTVMIGVNGVEIEHFDCNHSTGLITFLARVSKDMPEATLTNTTGNTWTIAPVVPPDPENPEDYELPIFEVGEWVITEGFTDDVHRGVVTASTPELLTFTWDGGQSAGSTAAATVRSDNTPRTGDEITAGYEFHVPVRFAVDRLPVRLEYYGVGSATEVKLIEVRPDQE